MRFTNLIALAAALLCCQTAFAGRPVLLPPGTNLDNSDADETEYSAIRQEFTGPTSGGRIEFRWQAFTSEFLGAAEDVFAVRLLDPTDNSIVDEQGWAVDPTPDGYMGDFIPLDAASFGITDLSQAPAGGIGLMYDGYHLHGGTGWRTGFLSIPQGGQTYALEILVADSVDRGAISSLAVDYIRARDLQGNLIPSLENPSFELGLAGWTSEGNTGIYNTLTDLFTGTMQVAGTQAEDGKLYALVSTGGELIVPEPSTMFLAGAAVLGLWRWRRRWPTKLLVARR
ncbi:PEP-CTERM sorting domain-containing protein [Aeoliella sp.]|uniref:PEP-CTERM sorting domain-containing protein n=1 Tax=Aeoliella sp. TaxID=2795800 RepID=UPI003CCB9ACF